MGGWRTDVWFGRLEVQQEGERADVREPPRVHATAGGVDAPASLHPGGSVAPSGWLGGWCGFSAKVRHEKEES